MLDKKRFMTLKQFVYVLEYDVHIIIHITDDRRTFEKVVEGLWGDLEENFPKEIETAIILSIGRKGDSIVLNTFDWHYRMNETPQQVKALEEALK